MNMFKRLATGLMAVATVGLLSTAVQAAPITIPPGLNPGDSYRLVFVTSTTRDATSSNIADYNAFVTADANAQAPLAALGTTWTVIGSTSTVDARDNTNTRPANEGGSLGFPIYLLDGRKMADSNDDLWDGSLDSNLEGSFFPLWTGTGRSGTGRSFELGTRFAEEGSTDTISDDWIQLRNAVTPNTFPGHFYAMSGVLTVASIQIPEPASLGLLALGLVGLGFARRRRAA